MTLITTQMMDFHDQHAFVLGEFEEKNAFHGFLEELREEHTQQTFGVVTLQLEKFLQNEINVLATPQHFQTTTQWLPSNKMVISIQGEEQKEELFSTVSLRYEKEQGQHQFELLLTYQHIRDKEPTSTIKMVGRTTNEGIRVIVYCGDKDVHIVFPEDVNHIVPTTATFNR